MESRIKEIINEEKEKERLAGNNIIRGLPETEKIPEKDAKEKDMKTITSLIQQILPGEPYKQPHTRHSPTWT